MKEQSRSLPPAEIASKRSTHRGPPCQSTALVDDLHLAIAPALLGAGEHLLGGMNLRALGYECTGQIAGARATHVLLRKR
jgi:hypothetical protein